MQLPGRNDYIDIHIHDGKPAREIFMVESLMAHEGKLPEDLPGIVYTYGIHPWFLDETNHARFMQSVQDTIGMPGIIAVGEAGFDKLRGPSMELQRKVFEQQAVLAEENQLPVIIHCVKAWDEILAVHKKLKPEMPWMIHGFRGNIQLAKQLLSRGMYISVWFNFALRKESAELLRFLPADRMFLETDGAEIDIRELYRKTADDRGITVDELKSFINSNFFSLFNLRK